MLKRARSNKYIATVLLILLYFGRLIIYIPTNPMILFPSLLSGFVVNPILYILLGFSTKHLFRVVHLR